MRPGTPAATLASMLDPGRMREVHVDPVRRRARVQAGGPTVVGGVLRWPAERICEIAAFYGPMMREAPEDLGGGLVLARGSQAGPTVSVVVSWTGPVAGAEAHLAPLRLLGPVLDT